MTVFLKQKHSVGVDGCRGIRKVDAERCLAASNEDQGRTLSAMAIFDSPARSFKASCSPSARPIPAAIRSSRVNLPAT
jgi:hypothetical protein